ncbi:MetQ/NlpA family ABC transporter substrate-binding protein [Jeotgalibaca ciconiae]|uniref:Lipoprotein n=1 Tax=Jeotgalibaca ciconiae TaxID=2496265 RepID=A0A3S9H9V7_9LACT|nr:MetQ/NlpA family ABC transporter substrate-binding protein [Jeotgalibaca ciconiae]AZP04114.1 MetQ/NlpA family ABC transporter substrate-binding protein [Jeotgalibaca ciconiae]HJB23815.1 MetQ/NlpA family ABC transporter substrate-binding protein [Candidatus Jeotgalibaca pullicola]
MNKKLISLSTATLVLFLGACGNTGSDADSSTGAVESSETEEVTEVSVGVVSEVEIDVWEDVKERLAEENIELTIEQFTDYVQPNVALSDGSLDLNAFQHVAYLEEFNANNGSDIVPIGFTYVSPLGLYSDSLTDYNDIPEGAEIAIPNDVTNGGRALLLLQAIDLITLDEAAGTNATVSDITDNPKNITFTELDASQTARALGDVDAAIINTNYATDSGLNPSEDALFLDTDNIAEVNEIYKNVIATRSEDAENAAYLKVVEAYQSEETAKKIEEVTEGNDVPAWE